MINIFIENLKKRHQQGLPGREHQLRMAAIARRQLFDAPDTARKAAVLVLLFPKNGIWHVILTERIGNPKDPHSHQISFPGGSVDDTDVDLEATALRETYEEIGIKPSLIHIIGAMTDLYIPVSNFHVHPFLAWTKHPPQYIKQETEVKHVIEAPIPILEDINNHKSKEIYMNKMFGLNTVPYFDVEGKMVWGATAMMLSELLELIKV